jgi:hypothetical protein
VLGFHLTHCFDQYVNTNFIFFIYCKIEPPVQKNMSAPTNGYILFIRHNLITLLKFFDGGIHQHIHTFIRRIQIFADRNNYRCFSMQILFIAVSIRNGRKNNYAIIKFGRKIELFYTQTGMNVCVFIYL